MRSCSIEVSGQSVVEYAILVAVVVTAVAAMQVYAKRGIQAAVKGAADQMSPFPGDDTGARAQVEGLRYESGERQNRAVAAAGKVRERTTATSTAVNKTTNMAEEADGSRTTSLVNDTTTTTGAVAGRPAGTSSYSEVVIEKR